MYWQSYFHLEWCSDIPFRFPLAWCQEEADGGRERERERERQEQREWSGERKKERSDQSGAATCIQPTHSSLSGAQHVKSGVESLPPRPLVSALLFFLLLFTHKPLPQQPTEPTRTSGHGNQTMWKGFRETRSAEAFSILSLYLLALHTKGLRNQLLHNKGDRIWWISHKEWYWSYCCVGKLNGNADS